MNKKNTLLLLLTVVFFVGVTMIYVNYYTSDDVRIFVEEPEKKSEFSKLAKNEKRTIIEGEIADQICAVTKGECPSHYIGNVQEDGSVMVGMTFSDTVKEKQFIFFIKNNTLSYEIKENEN